MLDDCYVRLAERLNAIPHGFPATETGVELQLLAKIFTPQEAALGAVMRLAQEPARRIAERASVDPTVATRALKAMARKGLVSASRGDGELTFGLMPFIVGIYEEQLKNMDEEFAALFEDYFRQSRGIVASEEPAVHRVVPVERAVPLGIEIFPYERASELVEAAKSWGVRNCICRLQQQLVGKGCGRPVENCVMLAPVEGAFDRSELSRPIAKSDALQILEEAAAAGLVHSTGNFQDRHYYICNCCTCCCGILRSVTEFANPAGVARSDFRAVVDTAVCVGCASCVSRCQFRALSIEDDACVVSSDRCVGCGLCVTACDAGALELRRRPDGDVLPPPASRKDWLIQRADRRGISLADIL